MLYILCFLLIPLMIDSLQMMDVDGCQHSVIMICCALTVISLKRRASS